MGDSWDTSAYRRLVRSCLCGCPFSDNSIYKVGSLGSWALALPGLVDLACAGHGCLLACLRCACGEKRKNLPVYACKSSIYFLSGISLRWKARKVSRCDAQFVR